MCEHHMVTLFWEQEMGLRGHRGTPNLAPHAFLPVAHVTFSKHKPPPTPAYNILSLVCAFLPLASSGIAPSTEAFLAF